MFKTIYGIKISQTAENKGNNQKSNIVSDNIYNKGENQKLSYPDSSLQKAYFVPHFTGGSKVIILAEERNRIMTALKKAAAITRRATAIYVDCDSNFPASLQNLAVKSHSGGWHVAKKQSGLYFLYTNSNKAQDNKSVQIPQSYTERLLDEVKKHPLVKSMDKLGIKSSNPSEFMEELTGMTSLTKDDPKKLHWTESLDNNENYFMKTKYKGYNILFFGDEISGHMLEISKGYNAKGSKKPVLIFQHLDDDAAENLDESIHNSGYTRHEETHAGRKDEKKYFKEIGDEIGFLSVKTKKDREKLAKLLEAMGFVRKKPDSKK